MMSIALLLLGLSCVSANSWKNCPNSNPLVQVKGAKYPNPIVLREGQILKFSGSIVVPLDAGKSQNFELIYEIQSRSRLGFWYTLPCFFKYFGSCKVDLSCQKLAERGYKGQCPLPAGPHSITDREVVIPKLPNLPSFLYSGEYWIRAQFKDKSNGQMLSCVEGYVNAA